MLILGLHGDFGQQGLVGELHHGVEANIQSQGLQSDFCQHGLIGEIPHGGGADMLVGL